MNLFRTSMLSRWGIPSTRKLIPRLQRLASENVAAGCAVEALQTGEFVNPDGDREPLAMVRIPIEQAALNAWLAGHCDTPLSIEVGFGMGTTAAIILAAREQEGREFEHKIFDPTGLAKGRGNIVRDFLVQQFGTKFQWVRKKSQFAIAEVASTEPAGETSFILIDGDHHFDGVFVDFFMADQILKVCGFIMVDDAAYPAIETLIQFVIHNRCDYEVSHLEIPITAVLRKVANDGRDWDHFAPFPVPQRENWTTAEELRGRQ